MLKKRNIKEPAVIGDNHFVFLDVFDKIFQVLFLHIGFDRFTVIGYGCYIVEMAIQPSGFNV
jgi:hypothetical protein